MLRQIEQAVCLVTLLSAALGCSSEQPKSQRPKVPDAPAHTDAGSSQADSGLTTSAADAVSPPSAADAGQPPSAAVELTLSDSERCPLGCEPIPSPLARESVSRDHAPPAISGGTLLTTHDAKWLIAADPDRDRLYFVDLARGELSHVRELPVGVEPGRLIEDDDGRIHVALRGSAALLTLTRAPDSQMTERPVCSQPRGLAYDAAKKEVHIACAGGELVSVGAEPSAQVHRKLELGRDLRDVIVRGQELLVTRFRSAEMLRVGADGSVQARLTPPRFVLHEQTQFGAPLSEQEQAPNTAWRAIDIPGKGSALLHQRSRVGQVTTAAGGYGSRQCSGIVQSALTIGLDTERALSADLGNVALAVDMAASPDATLLAVASPGNWGTDSQLAVFSLTGTSPLNPNAPSKPLSKHMLASTPSLLVDADTTNDPQRRAQVCMQSRTQFPTPRGQITSLRFVSDRELALFEREPAAISVIDLVSGQASLHIDLGQETRRDSGHELFHMRTFASLACASCHAEAGDDAHVWTFEGIGPRRTQSLRGGILGSEPFHWDGDMSNFDALLSEVFVKRMSAGEPVAENKSAALARWIDAQPRLASTVDDEAQVQRGKALFESAAVGCAGCHSGPLLTNNQTVDVGTGAALQVPALRNVSFRLPVMHDGCANTLAQRFDAACGGAQHGNTTQLSPGQIDDLVAYLNTL